ncbi:MAG: phosphotransferase, partial [Acidobacteria bacterium]|nr:phosphotransferase [Acidobacteriota bacterium]
MDIGAHPPTRATAADAVRLSRDIFGLEAAARPLPSEYDDNFRLDTAAGEVRVLKVMHPMREAAFVDMQCAALAAIAGRAPGLPVPRVVAGLDGRPFAATALADGAPRVVWMLSYLDGRPLAGLRPVTPELLGELGGALARLDLALAGFAHPAARRELKWDLAKAGWARGRAGLISDPKRRALVERVLDRYEAEAAPALPRLRRSVVYGDANEHNVLVRVEPGRLAEAAVAAAYASFGYIDPLEAVRPLIAAYYRVLPLTEEELAVLDVLVRTRLAVSVVNSACRSAAEPDDPYLTADCRPRPTVRPSSAGSRGGAAPSRPSSITIRGRPPSPSWTFRSAAGRSAPTRPGSRRRASQRRSPAFWPRPGPWSG